jgi:crotonobetainyl-CoA:carnitine CoA-transferase CaiB-like acyl-CoA transferase
MSAGVRASPTIPRFGPLAGVRVLDSGRLVAGPWAATYLGDFGAEVIHVEGPPFEPPFSDPTRTLVPLVPEGLPRESQVSESWIQYSRNKLSLGLDLGTAGGREVFRDLLKVSDIWIESSRPGTYDRLGFDDPTVHALNPKLTVVHVSGFGQTGAIARRRAPSYDLIGQAYSGFLSLQGSPDPEPPMRSGTALNDTVTGLAAAGAALMGYLESERSGLGQTVDVAQFEVFFQLLENLTLDFFLRGVVRGRHGTAHPRLYPYDVYRAKDAWVVVAAPTTESWTRLKAFLGIEHTDWDDPEIRRSHRAELDRLIGDFCKDRPAAQLELDAREGDAAISRVYDIAAIAADPHFAARGMFLEWEDPVAGRVKGTGIVPKFDRTPGAVWRGAPWLGQDNDRVLGAILGYPAGRIASLRAQRTIGSYPPPLGALQGVPVPPANRSE